MLRASRGPLPFSLQDSFVLVGSQAACPAGVMQCLGPTFLTIGGKPGEVRGEGPLAPAFHVCRQAGSSAPFWLCLPPGSWLWSLLSAASPSGLGLNQSVHFPCLKVLEAPEVWHPGVLPYGRLTGSRCF